jgi:SET domain
MSTNDDDAGSCGDGNGGTDVHAVWSELVAWVCTDRRQGEAGGGGFVHPNLDLMFLGGGARPQEPSSSSVAAAASHHSCRSSRGVFATAPIAAGSLLIRLPAGLAIDGSDGASLQQPQQRLPSSSTAATNDGARASDRRQAKPPAAASPWLRCLAALLGKYDDESSRSTSTASPHRSHHRPYLRSLPDTHETVWSWTSGEVDQYLAGTCPPSTPTTATTPATCSASSSSLSSAWKVLNDPSSRGSLRDRYREQIRPYLQHVGVIDRERPLREGSEEFARFATASQILATRGFHTGADGGDGSGTDGGAPPPRPKNSSNGSVTPSSSAPVTAYVGPYLLPVMDLLNHAPKRQQQRLHLQHSSSDAESSAVPTACTTLQRSSGGDFVMVAERDIRANEEVLHSYGDDLCSSQFLASFGFVPMDILVRAASGAAPSNPQPPTASAILFKQDIWQCCWDLIEANIPEQIAASMDDMDDEAWTVRLDRSRKADYVPDYIVIAKPSTVMPSPDKVDISHLDMLTDDLVTAACVPFLPRCAYGEITDRTLLDRSILEDFFLGKLVGSALLKAIEQRLQAYTPIPVASIEELILRRDGTMATSPSIEDMTKNDAKLLRYLLSNDRQEGELGAGTRTNSGEIDDAGETMSPLLQRQKGQRLCYGLAIRIEEKWALEALRRQTIALLAGLVDSAQVVSDPDDGNFCDSKKQRSE